MSVRIATFNVENLFARYRFNSNFNPAADDGFSINDLAFSLSSDDAKKLTGKAVKEADADVVCLQEVENLEVLERFNSRYLGGAGYKHRALLDSHDPRRIDVAVLSRHPITYINTHRHERNAANTTWLFSRDCFEVDVDVGGKTLSLYVNHFKSMMGGRDQTHDRRKEQVDRTAAIVDGWWSADGYAGNFAVLGDFNDYIDADTSLTSLVGHPHLVNVVERLPADERWTHYWAGGNEYRQLDYILLGQALADASPDAPVIVRQGMPYRADRYTGPRFPDVGDDNPKASDHAPLYIDLNLI